MVLAQQALPPTRQIPAASPGAAAGVRFADVTAAAGLSGFRHVSGGAEKNYILETTGSGVALWDFDGDGLLDIYLVNGSTLEPRRRRPAARGALPQQRRPHVPRRHRRGRRGERAVGPGRLRRRRRQRRRLRSLRHQLRSQPPVSKPRRRPIRRRGRPRGRCGRQLVDGLRLRRLRRRRLAGSLRRRLRCVRRPEPTAGAPAAPGLVRRRLGAAGWNRRDGRGVLGRARRTAPTAGCR